MSYTLILALVISFMTSAHPRRDHERLADANAAYLADNPPLFDHDYDRRKSASLLVAIQYRESTLDNDAIGDNGHSFCAGQIHDSSGGSLSLVIDPHACVSRMGEMIRISFRACRDLPATSRLALYARGRCDSKEGQRISRDRFALAARIESGARYPVVAVTDAEASR